MIDRKELKQTARMRMRQAQPSYIKVMLLWTLAGVVIPIIVSIVSVNPISTSVNNFYLLVGNGIDPWMALQSLQIPTVWITMNIVLGIVIALYQCLLGFGLQIYCLDLYRGDPCGPSSLFAGFSIAGRVIGARVLVFLFTLLWTLVLCVPFSLLVWILFILDLGSSARVTFVLLLYILLILGIVSIVLRYALVNFLLADQPELGPLGAVQRSKELMRGHKWELFVLEFSFLGWILLFFLIAWVALMVVGMALSAVALQSGPASMALISVALYAVLLVEYLPFLLWLTPYVDTSIAGFYEALAGSSAPDTQPWQPPLPPEV